MQLNAGFKRGDIRQLRREHAVDQDELVRVSDAERGDGRSSACQRRLIGRGSERRDLAQQRTQIGVFPFLDTPVRQAALGKIGKCRLTNLGDDTRARQTAARRGEHFA